MQGALIPFTGLRLIWRPTVNSTPRQYQVFFPWCKAENVNIFCPLLLLIKLWFLIYLSISYTCVILQSVCWSLSQLSYGEGSLSPRTSCQFMAVPHRDKQLLTPSHTPTETMCFLTHLTCIFLDFRRKLENLERFAVYSNIEFSNSRGVNRAQRNSDWMYRNLLPVVIPWLKLGQFSVDSHRVVSDASQRSDAQCDRNLIGRDDESAAAMIAPIIQQPGAAAAQVAISDAEHWRCHSGEGFVFELVMFLSSKRRQRTVQVDFGSTATLKQSAVCIFNLDLKCKWEFK